MADQSRDVAAVTAANAAFYQAIEHADLDLMHALWLDVPGMVVHCVHPGTRAVRGRSEVMRSWAAVMAGVSYIQFFITDVEVQLSGDVALVTCQENVLTVVDSPSGDPTGFAGGLALATNVFHRGGGGWRLWLHHASPVLSVSTDAQEETG